jgi:hypothetical protein
MNIEFDVVYTPEGGCAILPRETEIETARKAAAAKGLDEKGIAEICSKLQALRSRFLPHAKREVFAWKGLSYGDKTAARKLATNWGADGTPVFDREDFFDRQAAIAVGLDMESFGKLHPTLAVALREEVAARLTPSEAKLDFLFSSQTISAEVSP